MQKNKFDKIMNNGTVNHELSNEEQSQLQKPNISNHVLSKSHMGIS